MVRTHIMHYCIMMVAEELDSVDKAGVEIARQLVQHILGGGEGRGWGEACCGRAPRANAA